MDETYTPIFSFLEKIIVDISQLASLVGHWMIWQFYIFSKKYSQKNTNIFVHELSFNVVRFRKETQKWKWHKESSHAWLLKVYTKCKILYRSRNLKVVLLFFSEFSDYSFVLTLHKIKSVWFLKSGRKIIMLRLDFRNDTYVFSIFTNETSRKGNTLVFEYTSWQFYILV